MQKTKKFLAVCLSLLMLFSLCACKNEEPIGNSPIEEKAAPTESQAPDTAADEKDVRAVLETFAATFTRGDIGGLSDLFAKNTPQHENYKNADISTFFPAENLGVALDTATLEDFVRQIFAKFSFSVKTVSVEGTKANCVMYSKVPDVASLGNNIDIEAMLMQFMQEQSLTAESLAGKSEAELEEFQNSLMENFTKWLLPKVLETVPYHEGDKNVTLEKTDGKWYITQMDTLF